MYLGIKDVSTSIQRRFKGVHERVCTEVDRFLFWDYLVITLSIHPSFIFCLVNEFQPHNSRQDQEHEKETVYIRGVVEKENSQ